MLSQILFALILLVTYAIEGITGFGGGSFGGAQKCRAGIGDLEPLQQRLSHDHHASAYRQEGIMDDGLFYRLRSAGGDVGV